MPHPVFRKYRYEPEKMNFDDMLEVADSRMYEIKREKKKKAAK